MNGEREKNKGRAEELAEEIEQLTRDVEESLVALKSTGEPKPRGTGHSGEDLRAHYKIVRAKLEADPELSSKLSEPLKWLELKIDLYVQKADRVWKAEIAKAKRVVEDMDREAASRQQIGEEIRRTLLRYLIVGHGAAAVACVGTLTSAWTTPVLVDAILHVLEMAGWGLLWASIGYLLEGATNAARAQMLKSITDNWHVGQKTMPPIQIKVQTWILAGMSILSFALAVGAAYLFGRAIFGGLDIIAKASAG